MENNPELERAIFDQVIGAAPSDRANLINRLCDGDNRLRQRVEVLIRAAESDAPFLSEMTRRAAFDAAVASTDMTAEEADKLVGARIGPYKLLEHIGEGGFGAVYVAEQEKPVRRRVALKVIKLGMDTRQVIARFEAERQALAMMDHPNIARVLDAGTTDTGRPWFAMELVRGVPITEYCDAANLSATERLKLFIDVCHAVQHAHQKGVIHRDIKPGNVMVTLHDGNPVPKVIDFGIAKAVGAQLTDKTVYTQHRQLIGTPAYMAPEQAEMSGLDVDTRADVYSLGVLLYELLTGSPPFAAAELMKAGWAEMQRIIREVEPIKPSTRVNTLGDSLPTIAARRRIEPKRLSLLLRGDLDWISMKCLEKDRTRRYGTANDLVADVRRYLGGEPVLAAPPSIGYRLHKFVRKHRGQVIASALVAVSLLAGLATTTWMWRDALEARLQADETARRAQLNTEHASNGLTKVLKTLKLSERKEPGKTTLEFPGSAFETLIAIGESAETSADADLTVKIDHLIELGCNTAQELKQQRDLADAQRAAADAARIAESKAKDEALSQKQSAELYAYASDIASIQSFMLAGYAEGTRSRLETVPAHLRGWEWNYLNASADHSIFTLRNVNQAVFTPDGSRVITCQYVHEIIGYDVRTGRQLFWRTFDAYSDVRLSPDGRYLLANARPVRKPSHTNDHSNPSERDPASANNTQDGDVAEVIDVDTGAILARLGEAGPEWTRWKGDPVFSRDASKIVTCSDRSRDIIVWETVTGRKLATIKNQIPLTLSIDGSRLVTHGREDRDANDSSLEDPDRIGPNVAALWDVSSNARLLELRGHMAPITTAEFNHDGTRILTVSEDNTARVWDAGTGGHLCTIGNGKPDICWATFSSNGQQVLFAATGLNLSLHEADTGLKIRELGEHGCWPVGAGCNDSRIATVQFDGTIRVSDGSDEKQAHVIRRLLGTIGEITFSPDGRFILARDSSTPGRAAIYDAKPSCGDVIEDLQEDLWSACAAAFNSDGTRLAVGLNDSTVTIRDAVTRCEVVRLRGHEQGITSLAFSRDGRYIATGSLDKTARIWDADTGRALAVLRGHDELVKVAGFNPEGTQLLTSSPDCTTRLWNVATGNEVARFPYNEENTGLDENESEWKPVHLTGGESVALSPDGKRVAIPNGRQLTVYDTATSAKLATIQSEKGLFLSLLWSPDGEKISTAMYHDLFLKMWDANSGQLLWSLSRSDDAQVTISFTFESRSPDKRLTFMNPFAFSPDGRQLAVAHVGVLDAATGEKTVAFKPCGYSVNSIAYSPDGTRVIGGCDDGFLRIWHAETGHELAVLPGHDNVDGETSGVLSAFFSPDGVQIITTSDDGTARICDSVPWPQRHIQLQQSTR